MQERKYTVYCHISPSGKRYVGITSTSVEERWRNGYGYKYNKAFWNAIQKYGWERIEHIICAENVSASEAVNKEAELIAFWKTANPKYGYNILHGGESLRGQYHHTEEAKRRISLALSKRQISEETREKWRIAKKGYKLSREAIERGAEKRRGYKHTPEALEKIAQASHERVWKEESKKKISAAKIGKPRPKECINKMVETRKKSGNYTHMCQCVDTGKIYNSMVEAAIEYGVTPQSISAACNGRSKTCCKLHWSYVKEVS